MEVQLNMAQVKSSDSVPAKTREWDDKEIRKCSSPSLDRPGHDCKVQKEAKKKVLPKSNFLKQEIVELETYLEDQLVVRRALETALVPNCLATGMSNEESSPILKSTKDLIREIAVLELEVKHLEQHLLTLYRMVFELQISPLRPDGKDGSKESMQTPQAKQIQEARKAGTPSDKFIDSSVHRSHSTLSYRPDSSRMSDAEESLARALRSCHSQPFSFTDVSHGAVSLAEYLGTSVTDHIPDTPNNLSEELLRCMVGVYCKLAEPPIIVTGHHHLSSLSSASSFSSTSDMSSPKCKKELMLDTRLVNPFHAEGLMEFSGPYNTAVDVHSLSREPGRTKDAKDLLQTYKIIMNRLETVDVSKMTGDEKLAFWVNIHNALVMNAYILFGVPQNSSEKASILIKAAAKIGGRTVDAAVIQDVILGCHAYSNRKWLGGLLPPKKTKGRAGNGWNTVAIDCPEPLVRFALCSGSHSDPKVRLYMPRAVSRQLEEAKEEFICASVGVRRDQQQKVALLLPKVVENYAKDLKLSLQDMSDMVQRHLPEMLRAAVPQQGRPQGKISVEWAPYDSGFRYLISRELAFPHLS